MYTDLPIHLRPVAVPFGKARVLVFRTTVNDPQDVQRLRPLLDDLVVQGRWTFDLEDTDRILRVETTDLVRERVVVLLNGYGFECDELE